VDLRNSGLNDAAPLPSFDDGVAVKLRDRISALADNFPLYRGLLS
jgi:hypothetical protein